MNEVRKLISEADDVFVSVMDLAANITDQHSCTFDEAIIILYRALKNTAEADRPVLYRHNPADGPVKITFGQSNLFARLRAYIDAPTGSGLTGKTAIAEGLDEDDIPF